MTNKAIAENENSSGFLYLIDFYKINIDTGC